MNFRMLLGAVCMFAVTLPAPHATAATHAARAPSLPGTAADPGPALSGVRLAQAKPGGAAPAAKTQAAPAQGEEAIATVKIFDGVSVSLDYASVVDKTQLVLEYTIINQGEKPVLAIIAAFRDSSVGLRGEARPRLFVVQGFATCPTIQSHETENCMKNAPDAEWTLLQPQVPYEFQITTRADNRKIKSTSAFARIRFLFRQGDQTVFRDAAFAHITVHFPKRKGE